MPRISKSACEDIAAKMTSKFDQDIEDVKKEMSDIVRAHLHIRTPKVISDLYDQYPEYFRSPDSRYVSIGRHRYFYPDLNGIPVPDKDIHFTDATLSALNVLYDKKDALEFKRRKLREELVEILYKLGTYKKISEHLPEALPFLPKPEAKALPQINLSEFRNKLKKELE